MRGVVLGVIALMSLAGESVAADTPAATSLIPAATFADQPFVLQPLLSPDGLRIAARSTVEGKSKLVIFLIADLKANPRIFDVGDKKIADVNWAGPNRVLMTISTTLKLEGEDYPVTRLLEIDLATGKAQYLDPRSNGFLAGDVLYTDPAGAWVLVSSQDDVYSTPSVKRIDLATGAVKVAEKQRPDVWDWYATITA